MKESGVDAIMHELILSPELRPKLLTLLSEGKTPQEALAILQVQCPEGDLDIFYGLVSGFRFPRHLSEGGIFFYGGLPKKDPHFPIPQHFLKREADKLRSLLHASSTEIVSGISQPGNKILLQEIALEENWHEKVGGKLRAIFLPQELAKAQGAPHLVASPWAWSQGFLGLLWGIPFLQDKEFWALAEYPKTGTWKKSRLFS